MTEPFFKFIELITSVDLLTELIIKVSESAAYHNSTLFTLLVRHVTTNAKLKAQIKNHRLNSEIKNVIINIFVDSITKQTTLDAIEAGIKELDHVAAIIEASSIKYMDDIYKLMQQKLPEKGTESSKQIAEYILRNPHISVEAK